MTDFLTFISYLTKVCRKNLTINYAYKVISSAFKLTATEISLIENCLVNTITSTQNFTETNLNIFVACLPNTIGQVTIDSAYSTQLTTINPINSLPMNKTN